MEEKEFLLNKESNQTDVHDGESVSEEEWSDSSDCSSYYSGSESSEAEWESYVDEKGQLLFIDCHPFVTQTNNENENKTTTNFTTKNQTRKSTRSKFLRLIRRQESKRRSKRYARQNECSQENKVTFHDSEEGEVKKVVLHIDNSPIHKYGRRSKLVETLLGINVSTFSDGKRLMIAGFPPLSVAKNDKNIKIGDWLKSINDTEVNAQNLIEVMEELNTGSVMLELQRVTGIEVTKQPPTNELSNQSSFVKELTNVNVNDELLSLLLAQPIGIIYLNIQNLTETGPEFEEVIYCFPRPLEKNVLCLCRGAYLTINHLIGDITSTKPVVTASLLKNRLSYIFYKEFNGKLLLLMLPKNRFKRTEIILLGNELIRMFQFMYNTVDEVFDVGNRTELDHFLSRFFTRILSSGLWEKAEQNVLLNCLEEKALLESPFQFENLLPTAHNLSLPMEAQMQIDDALSELEACDYREWNEDPLDCQRLFTILGSALYYSGYLLQSHFIHGDLIDVHLYCRQQGLFHLSQTEPIKSLVHWREVYPYSCTSRCSNSIVLEDSRQYLLIVGSGKDLLAVIMEAGGCTEPPENDLGPHAFYVEEAQATLAHLQELGIFELASRWMQSNPGSQVTIPQGPTRKRKTDFLGNIHFGNSTSPNNKDSTLPSKKPEVTSILKRRNSDQGPLSQSGSTFSIPDDVEMHSEDSVSQSGYSERSEVSIEPVIGRRALREQGKNMDDSEGESDIDDYRDGSQISSSSYDLSELRQALLNETGDIRPMQLNAGKDVILFHYIQLDITEGILLCPPECRKELKTLNEVLNNFRKICQHIHMIFQNTLRFKSMQSQDMAKSVMNKNLIAVKEYGTLFDVNYQDDNQKKATKISYWVIGRLFHMPHPRELYVCYQDVIPQNAVEIAFKLAASMPV